MKRLDYESDKTYELAITIRDSGAPPLYALKTAYVQIEITDSNDHSPRFEKSEFVGYIRENRRQFVVVPFKVTAVDRDAGKGGIFATRNLHRIYFYREKLSLGNSLLGETFTA